LFFAWGFVCANNDPLIAAARRIFALSYTEALFTHIVFFFAFATISLPAAALLARIGATRTILIALGSMLAGCLVIQIARWEPEFAVVLSGLFLLAAGVTTLQVAANPLAAALGPAEHRHFRLTLAQSLNSLGVVCGVHFGARFLLTGLDQSAATGAGAPSIAHAFLVIGGFILCLVLLMLGVRRTIDRAAPPPTPGGGIGDALRSPWAIAGAAAIGLYVGAEVSIGSILIPFLSAPGTLALPAAEAGALVANLYWGGALVGRFAGSWALRLVPAPRLLALFAASAVALCLAALLLPGPIAAWCVLAIGLFNSILFPTIFGLTLERSGVSEAATSGLLCVAIGAGAVVPLLVGRIADTAGLGWAFAVPMLGYAYVLGFAWRAARSPA
jgi:FHS family L-fucose permease-like MFS transporter